MCYVLNFAKPCESPRICVVINNKLVAVEGLDGGQLLLAIPVQIAHRHIRGRRIQQLFHRPCLARLGGGCDPEYSLVTGGIGLGVALPLHPEVAMVAAHTRGDGLQLGGGSKIPVYRGRHQGARFGPVGLLLGGGGENAAQEIDLPAPVEQIKAVNIGQIHPQLLLPLAVNPAHADDAGVEGGEVGQEVLGGQKLPVGPRKWDDGHGPAGLLPHGLTGVILGVDAVAGTDVVGGQQIFQPPVLPEGRDRVAAGEVT